MIPALLMRQCKGSFRLLNSSAHSWTDLCCKRKMLATACFKDGQQIYSLKIDSHSNSPQVAKVTLKPINLSIWKLALDVFNCPGIVANGI